MYLIIFVLILFFSKVDFCYAEIEDKKVKNKKIYIVFCCILFILLYFLKHDYVGSDTQNYRFIYNNIQGFEDIPNEFDINTELLYLLVNVVFKSIGLDFRLMMLFFAVIYMTAIGKLVFYYSTNACSSFLLFFCFGDFIFFTTTRQAIALSFTIFAFLAWNIQKNKFLAFFYSLLAFLFHTSGLVFFIYFIFDIIPLSKKKISIVFILFCIFYVFRIQIVSFVLVLTGNIDYKMMVTGGYLQIIVYLCFSIAGYLYYDSIISKYNRIQPVFAMILLALLMLPLGKYNPFFFRIAKYFTIYSIVFIPSFISKLRDMPMKVLIVFCVLAYSFISVSNSAVRLFPYVFFFQEYPLSLLSNNYGITLLSAGGW